MLSTILCDKEDAISNLYTTMGGSLNFENLIELLYKLFSG